MRCAARKHEAHIVDVDAILLKFGAYLGSESNVVKTMEVHTWQKFRSMTKPKRNVATAIST
jgi:predicted secreted acid phosphatase